MAMAFLGHTPDGHKLVVDHINGDRSDNRIENLQVVTSRVNSTKDVKLGISNHLGVKYRDGGWESDTVYEKRKVRRPFPINHEPSTIRLRHVD